MPLTLVLVVAVIVLVVALLFAAKLKGGGADGERPYYAKKPLTTAERVLYFRLVRALPDKIILAQIYLSRLIG